MRTAWGGDWHFCQKAIAESLCNLWLFVLKSSTFGLLGCDLAILPFRDM